MFGWDEQFPLLGRINALSAMFVSPHGTGASRYVDVAATDHGLLATWQQSQPDGSQPLVRHLLPMDQVEAILAS